MKNAGGEDVIDGIESVLTGYTKMSGCRKPEVTYTSTYSYTNYNEAQRVLEKAIDLENIAKKYYDQWIRNFKGCILPVGILSSCSICKYC